MSTTAGHRLPLEIWFDIFSYISDSKELGNCRLICRSLDPVAEKVMLKQVPLDTDKNARKLYSYLTQKPWITRSIQCVKLTPYGIELYLFKEIMRLLLTPHLRMLDGYVTERDNDYVSIILDIVRDPAFNCIQLEKLPCSGHLCKAYVDLACHFKATLQSMDFVFWKNLDQALVDMISIDFLQLKKVTQLRIYLHNSADDSLEQLEQLLKGLVHLETLDWETMEDYYVEDPPHIYFNDWLATKVSQVESLHTLTIQHNSYPCDPEALLYLSYKYPNIKTLEIQGEWSGRQPYYTVFENVEAFHLKKLRVHCWGGIERLADVWKRQGNSVSIKYGGPDVHYTQGKCTLDIKKEKHLDHTVFDIDDAFYTIPLEAFVVFLAALSKSVITELELDLAFFEEHAHYENTFPSDLLEAAQLTECLKIRANGLYLSKRTNFPRLHTVELIGMNISTKDMTNLGLSSPSLQHLTLLSCCVSEKLSGSDLRHERVIDLSRNQLITLSIHGEAVSQDNAKTDIKEKDEETHIYVTIGELEHHFIATSYSNNTCLQLFQRSDSVHSKASTAVVTIKCTSLQRLKVDLDDIRCDMEFNTDGSIKKTNPNIQR
ncbi:hypothetical protein MUCCIDRAFT_114245 [Mucor lusitanicus CBS 277.49]|uniref:F-box domain-containing protein n=2 Tax=Mucor circinelloides f. lusitanicus TaxID=29924 RepID=A0A168HQP0_MUCCL|nr:hypothetical protein MUCCIDRAFT_114245 [Mucor lusitanicus CBS 277.49]